MSYVYVGTRNANNEGYVINEIFVASTEEDVMNQMVPFVKETVASFVEGNIDVVENVVGMTYEYDERSDPLNDERSDEFHQKVALFKTLSIDEIVESLSPKELLTIYGNLYQEEELIVIAGYNEDGEQEIVVMSNMIDD
jgi:uncharacterized membrane protein